MRAFGGGGDAYGAILASWALGPPQCKEGMRGFMGRRGGWRRWRVAGLAGLAGAADAAMVGTAGAAVAGAAVQGHDGAGARRWWVLRAGALVGTAAVRGGCCARGR